MDQTNQNPTPQITSKLNVPVVSPTHFDRVETPRPPAVSPPPEPKSRKSPLIIALTTLAAVLLLSSFVGNVFLYLTHQKLQSSYQSAQTQLESQSAVIQKIESQLKTKIKTPNQLPVLQPLREFIYLHDWRLRLKLPTDLAHLSYIFNQGPDSSVCFNAVQKGSAYFPSFADVKQNPGGMGCLVKVPTSKGSVDTTTNLSYGEKILTRGEYNYFYAPPVKIFAKETSEQNLETASVKILKNMLTSNLTFYK